MAKSSKTVKIASSNTKTKSASSERVGMVGLGVAAGVSVKSAKSAGTAVSFQVKSSLTGNYIMRDSVSGKFSSSKSGRPFKGVVVKETIAVPRNPHINKAEAIQAEQDMLETLNSQS